MFAELPRLLERAGPGQERAAGPAGQITALFTVLVEGDDHNEPVADAVRGILDGHVILDRRIAEGGRYPAVDVLRSLVARRPRHATRRDETALVRRARAILALHADMADMVRLGAYRAGHRSGGGRGGGAGAAHRGGAAPGSGGNQRDGRLLRLAACGDG